MNIKKVLSSVVSVFKKLGNPQKDIEVMSNVIQKVAPVVNAVYPIVQKIAELTPNKTDDQILDAFQKFGLRELFVPGQNTSHQLRQLAVTALKKSPEFVQIGGSSVGDYLINTAVELAVSKLKEEISSNV